MIKNKSTFFEKLKFYRNTIFIWVIVLMYKKEVKVEYFKENILYFCIFSIICVHIVLLLYIINQLKNWKIITFFSNFLQYLFPFVAIYMLAFNFWNLMTAVDHILFDHDLIFRNYFFQIQYIYTEERLLYKLRSTYEQISKIKSPLSEELCLKILGNATTMAEVEMNVMHYCKYEPNNLLQRFKNYYYHHPEIVLLNGLTCFGILLLVITMPSLDYHVLSELKSINFTLSKGLSNLAAITANLITEQHNLLEHVNFADKAELVHKLTELRTHALVIKQVISDLLKYK